MDSYIFWKYIPNTLTRNNMSEPWALFLSGSDVSGVDRLSTRRQQTDQTSPWHQFSKHLCAAEYMREELSYKTKNKSSLGSF